jgi:hypothetical protein
LTTFPAKFACNTLSRSSAPPTLVLARFPFCTIFPFKPSELCPMVMLIYDHGTFAQFRLACARCFRFLEPRDANRHLCSQIAIRVCFSPICIVKSGLPMARILQFFNATEMLFSPPSHRICHHPQQPTWCKETPPSPSTACAPSPPCPSQFPGRQRSEPPPFSPFFDVGCKVHNFSWKSAPELHQNC